MAAEPMAGVSGVELPGSSRLPRRFPSYPALNVLFFATFLLFVAFRYVDGGNRMDILAAVRFEFLLGGAAILMSIIQLSSRSAQIGNGRMIIVFIVLLFVAMMLQLPLAADPAEARRVFVDRAFKFSFLTFLIVVQVQSPKSLQWFIGVFMFAIFYVTLEATQGLISGALVWENQGIPRLHGAVPMYAHPNSLGGVAMGSLPFVIFLFRHVKKWILKVGLIAVAATSMACVIYSGSRTAYLGFFSLLFWVFFQSPRKGRFILISVVVAAAALPFTPPEYIERFKSIGGEEAEGHSKDARIQILKDAVIVVQENPLGIGVASFPAARAARFGRSQDTHNLYLEVATNLGIQGFIIFAGLVFVLMATFRRCAFTFKRQQTRLLVLARRRNPPSSAVGPLKGHIQDLRFFEATAKAIAGFVAIRLVLGLFGMDLYEIYWWFAAGMALSLSGLVVHAQRRTRYFEFLLQPEDS